MIAGCCLYSAAGAAGGTFPTRSMMGKGPMLFSLLLLLLLPSPSAAAEDVSRISVAGRWFVDSHRRVRIFHGFNDVGPAKGTGPFTGDNYLPKVLITNDTRLNQLINEYGFNGFRISASWAAVQPEPGVIDDKYLAAMVNVTQKLASFGAYFLLDMHQDGLSSAFGAYDGMPLWVANRTKPRHKYPWPYQPGKGGGDAAEAVAQCFQDIYKDTHGGLTAWAAAWKAFATTFRSTKGIIGYELLNEPFAGDIYEDPLLLLPGNAGAQNLLPAYDKVAASIRAVDDETVILFEPTTWGMIFKSADRFAGPGFSHVPGGSEYANRSAYSFHYYCWLGRMYPPANPGQPYPASKKALCQGLAGNPNLGLGPKTFRSVQQTMRALGGASFLSEWGGIYFTPDVTKPNSTQTLEALWIMDEADAQLQSWTHWELNYMYTGPWRQEHQHQQRHRRRQGDDNTDATVADTARVGAWGGCDQDDKCIKAFIRPFAQAIAGTPVTMRFDHRTTKDFTLVFEPDYTIAAPTEIFLPPYVYPGGVSVSVEPAGAPFAWRTCLTPGRQNVLCVVATAAAAAAAVGSPADPSQSGEAARPTQITLIVSPK